MTKKVYSPLFLCLISCFIAPCFATGNPWLDKNEPFYDEQCDTPAPDSFRVVSRGSDFINLAWAPIGPLSTHTLKVFCRTTAGDWELLNYFTDLAGDSYTLSNIPFNADCRFLLSTNCPSNEPSSSQAELFDKIILEVTTGGRVPINPQPVSCLDINILGKKWIGFSITTEERGETISHLFEFKLVKGYRETKINIKRVINESRIVAVGYTRRWPTPFEPELDAPNPFELDSISMNGSIRTIGLIDATYFFETHAIDLCIANPSTPPWNNNYIFTPLVANEVSARGPQIVSKNNIDSKNTIKEERIKAQSPFKDEINLFIKEPNLLNEIAKIRLFNTSGELILEDQFAENSAHVSIPTNTLQKGMYVLKIKTKQYAQTIKLIKIE